MNRDHGKRSEPNGGLSEPAALTLLAAAFIVPLAIHAALFKADVPLGKPGTLTYPYSFFFAERLLAIGPAALAAGAALLCLQIARRAASRWAFAVLGVAALLLTGAGAIAGAPKWRTQNAFNMLSPSHDGAFLIESEYAEKVGVVAYLRAFQQRAQTPAHEMKGTRIISNPPGATLLALGVERLLEVDFVARSAIALAIDEEGVQPVAQHWAARGLLFAAGLVVLWVVGVALTYAVARLFMGPAASMLTAIIAGVTPMTVLFTPGKDPAQLCSAMLPAWLWLLSIRARSPLLGACSACAFVAGISLGLVHLWLAAVLVGASLIAPPMGDRGTVIRRTLLPALLSCGACFIALALAGIDAVAIIRAVAGAQANVTRGLNAMPFAWQLLGVPLFLLFCGPGVWWATLCALATGASRERNTAEQPASARFGRALCVLSAGLMLATTGFTNLETPRLWIPFVPFLVLGCALWKPTLAWSAQHSSRLASVLVVLQLLACHVQWSLMDMRESELRLRIAPGAAPRMYH